MHPTGYITSITAHARKNSGNRLVFIVSWHLLFIFNCRRSISRGVAAPSELLTLFTSSAIITTRPELSDPYSKTTIKGQRYRNKLVAPWVDERCFGDFWELFLLRMQDVSNFLSVWSQFGYLLCLTLWWLNILTDLVS